MKSSRLLHRLLPMGAAAMALAVVTLITSPALAWPHRGGGPMGFERIEHRLERLDLDSETREAALEILDEARAHHGALAPEIHEARDLMRELLAADAPDEEAVLAQADAIGALKREASHARVRTLLALRALLTAEQWQELHPPRGERGETDDPRQ